VFALRFDMRAPQPGASTAALYGAALDMSAWADERGCAAIVVCEHHASPDGYLPAPLLLASAIAARTEWTAIMVAAVLLPLWDPVRLVEEMNVLDIISRGRVSYVLALGYRPEEFEQFGVDRRRRGAIAEEKLALLMQLRAGAPVVHEGRRIHATPSPLTSGGPRIMLGGGSIAAAERAGRFGLGLQANGGVAGMREAYEAAARAHGHEPGPISIPDGRDPSVVFVADDVDAAWAELGPYLLHDARMYSEWNPGAETTALISHARSVDELRATSTGYRIMSVSEAREYVAHGGALRLAPLCGGVPPERAWPYLERAVEVAATPDSSPKEETTTNA
jgi:alkanesulfonate monooxygenase SsuD/methylene tetrahydromethanopterin reductase-like flavin-dependent oxidoreductase (luciferase family)